jgi:hypothetical protein
MSALTRLFEPFRHAAQAFFKHDLAFQRGDKRVQLVLQDRRAVPRVSAASLAEAAARKDKQELTLMREQLAAVLDDMPDTRQTLRHLAFVEQALAKKGLKALRKVPLDVLQRALEQLETLVTNWSPVGLASLRSKMAVSVIDREHQDGDAEADAYRTAAVLDVAPLRDEAAAGPARSDDDALAAAYAALGHSATIPFDAVEMQSELGSQSQRSMRPKLDNAEPLRDIQLRELQS